MRRQIPKSGGRLPRDKRCTVTRKERAIFYYRRIHSADGIERLFSGKGAESIPGKTRGEHCDSRF